MTNFTRKDKAEALMSIGNTRIKVATKGRGTLGGKISNKDRLAMTRKGVQELLKGTRDANRLKKNQSTDSNN